MTMEQISKSSVKIILENILRRYRTAITVVLFLLGIILFLISTYFPGYIGGMLSNIGTFLAGVVAISAIYEWLIKAEDRTVFLDDLSELLDKKLGTQGVIYYADRRAIVDLENRFCSAKKEICILQTNLTTILEYIDCFKEARLRTPNVKIRILTLHPKSRFLNARGRSLWSNADRGTFKIESKGSLEGFIRRARRENLDCEIRLYDDLPTFVMFKIDSRVIIAFITASGLGRHHAHIELSERLPGVSETFVRHFEILWERAQPLQELLDD